MNQPRKSEKPERSARDEFLALCLAQGMTRTDAAKQTGLNERTVYRKLDDPSFEARVHELRRELLDGTIGKLIGSAVKAAETLAGLLDAPNPPSVRLAAARAILADLITVQSHAELNERIIRLEQQINAS